MKRQELIALGIRPRDLEEVDFDLTQVVINEEFRRRVPESSGEPDYRVRSVDRLVRLQRLWHSEQNTAATVVERYVRVRCPYCSAEMTWKGCSGNSSFLNFYFSCGCGATSQISLPPDGVSFTPPNGGG